MDSSVQPIKNDCIIILQQSTEFEINRNIIFISTLSLRIVMPLHKAEASARDRKRARKNYHNICNNYSHLIWAFSKMKSTYGLCLVCKHNGQMAINHDLSDIQWTITEWPAAATSKRTKKHCQHRQWQRAQSVKVQRIISILIISLKMQTGNNYFRCCLFWWRPKL